MIIMQGRDNAMYLIKPIFKNESLWNINGLEQHRHKIETFLLVVGARASEKRNGEEQKTE